MSERVFLEIKKIIKEKFKKDVEINSIISETGIDSLDLLDLIVESEEKYNIKISDEELLNLKTIKDVVDIICKKI